MPVRRSTTRRRNPSDVVLIRTLLKEARDALLYGIHEIAKTTVGGEGNPTKAQLAKFNKAYKNVMKAILALTAAQTAMK